MLTRSGNKYLSPSQEHQLHTMVKKNRGSQFLISKSLDRNRNSNSQLHQIDLRPPLSFEENEELLNPFEEKSSNEELLNSFEENSPNIHQSISTLHQSPSPIQQTHSVSDNISHFQPQSLPFHLQDSQQTCFQNPTLDYQLSNIDNDNQHISHINNSFPPNIFSLSPTIPTMNIPEQQQSNKATAEQQSSRATKQQSSREAEQQSSRAAEHQTSRAAEQQSSRETEHQSSRAAEQQSSRVKEQQSNRAAADQQTNSRAAEQQSTRAPEQHKQFISS